MSHEFKADTIRSKDVDLDVVDFAVDTALNWDGDFPEPGKGDYLATIGHVDGDPAEVLVSRRYTSAGSRNNAADIALSAFAERHAYATDDEGDVVEVAIEGMGTGRPCWVERVATVVP